MMSIGTDSIIPEPLPSINRGDAGDILTINCQYPHYIKLPKLRWQYNLISNLFVCTFGYQSNFHGRPQLNKTREKSTIRQADFLMVFMGCGLMKITLLKNHRNRQGSVKTRTFEPTNEGTDFWSASHSYNFIIRVK